MLKILQTLRDEGKYRRKDGDVEVARKREAGLSAAVWCVSSDAAVEIPFVLPQSAVNSPTLTSACIEVCLGEAKGHNWLHIWVE